ncbi:NAD(P)-dependent oxidoreductase [Microbacterium aurum]
MSRPRFAFPDASPDDDSLLSRALEIAGVDRTQIDVSYGVPSSPAEWVQRIGDAEATLLGWSIPDDALRQLPGLRRISFLGTGVADNVNLSLAAELGIDVRTVHGYGDDAVAEHALALLLAAARGIPLLDREMREGKWAARPGVQLAGKTLGVVGLGGIGMRMATLAQGIGMRVVGWNRSVREGATQHGSIPLLDLPELFATSDAVSLHLALTPESEGIIDAPLINALAPGAILVNTARAAIVDRDALLARLGKGDIVAALDVFDPEPLSTEDPLRSLPDTVLTPHVAYDTPEAAEALFGLAVANLIESAPPGTDASEGTRP